MENTLENTSLEVKINNVRNRKGNLLVSLFKNFRGFPSESSKAFRNESISVGHNENTVVFDSIPLGTYAIAVLHDESNTGKLDTNFLGIPTEGYGSSNNKKKLFRAPTFEEASFELTKSSKKMLITLNY